MKQIDVVYFIEHVARELDIACAVKHLARRDHHLSMEIVGIASGRQRALQEYSPRVVALPYCMSVADFGLDEIVQAWPQARYLNLSFEQVLGRTQKQFKAPRDAFAREYVLHHAWGEFFAEFLVASGVPRKHIVVNGNPVYTLYQAPYKAYYGNPRQELAQRYHLDPAKRWVFIPENYGWAFFSDRLIQDRIRRGFDPEHAYQYRDFARRSLRAAAAWWVEATALSSVEMIIRPRPAIPRRLFVETLVEMVGDIPETLHIIKEGTVREWLFASDVVFSSYSTTLLEAAITQKPLYMLTPYPFPDFLFAEWYPLAETIETEDAFLDVITRSKLDANWKPLEAWVQQRMMRDGDAIANLAAILASLVSGDSEISQPIEIARSLESGSWKKVVKSVRQLGWKVLRRTPLFRHHWMAHEGDHILAPEVNQRVARWAAVLDQG